jgi:hypothetical protein
MKTEVGVIRTFPVKLTDPELLDRAKRAGQYRGELSALCVEFDDLKRKMKSQIELKEQELNQMLNVVQSGVEERTELCKQEKNYDSGVMEFYYQGAMVDSRPLSHEERQLTI